MASDPLDSLHALGERVKELTALHSASMAILRDDADPAGLADEIAAVLPPAFQYPEVTAARVRLGMNVAATPGFVESPETLRTEFRLTDGTSGSIEVIYTDSRPDADIGPFLTEELSLVRTLGDMACATYDRRYSLFVLAERVKEMTALHGASTLMLSEDPDPEGLVHGLASVLPGAFRYPEAIAARVRLGAYEAVMPRFVESSDALRWEFKLTDGASGSIEVIYTDARPTADIGPFLTEELSLIRTLGDMARAAYDRKAAIVALRDSEARMRFYATSTFEGIVVHAHGRFVEVNDQFAALIGVPDKALVGTSIEAVLVPELREAFRRHLRQRTGEAFAAKLLRKDGQVLSVEVRTTAAVHGGLSAAVSVFRDITERKQLEDQLHRTLRLESLGTLAAGIAHDLNNVLAPVMLSVTVLQKRLTDPTMIRLVESLGKSANRGRDIVKQILIFARGSREPFAPLQIGAVVAEIHSFMRHSFGDGISIRLEFPDDLPPVMGDSTQLHQVLLNLCINARDAMGGEGTLTIKAANQHIDEDERSQHNAVRAGNYVVLAVADTGHGIPAHIRSRIFEPFFSTKDVGKGTGLGLSTVNAIVRDHHGFITITSEVGQGTEFRIFLPAAPDIALGGPPDEFLPIGSGEHILVVDDEQSVLHIASETLETYGYRVSTAADGAAAIVLLEKLGPGAIDVLLTDASMPAMNGFESIRAARDIDDGIKVILSSGSLNEAQKEGLAGLRIDGYLNKPYTSSELLLLLQAVLH
jgi:PAS domain S-box-containing protein